MLICPLSCKLIPKCIYFFTKNSYKFCILRIVYQTLSNKSPFKRFIACAVPPCRAIAANWQWMTVRIEHPLIKWQNGVIHKSEVQILESGRKKVRRLIVQFFAWLLIHIFDAGITSCLGNLSVHVNCMCKLPRPVAIYLVMSQTP